MNYELVGYLRYAFAFIALGCFAIVTLTMARKAPRDTRFWVFVGCLVVFLLALLGSFFGPVDRAAEGDGKSIDACLSIPEDYGLNKSRFWEHATASIPGEMRDKCLLNYAYKYEATLKACDAIQNPDIKGMCDQTYVHRISEFVRTANDADICAKIEPEAQSIEARAYLRLAVLRVAHGYCLARTPNNDAVHDFCNASIQSGNVIALFAADCQKLDGLTKNKDDLTALINNWARQPRLPDFISKNFPFLGPRVRETQERLRASGQMDAPSPLSKIFTPAQKLKTVPR